MATTPRSLLAPQSSAPTGGRYFFAFVFAVALFVGCAGQQLPFHGFTDASGLDKADTYVLSQSVGGKLDPNNLAQEDQRYNHNNIAYNRTEEGYYQWGAKLYGMGYRDVYYVRDLEPRAFRRALLDVYDQAIQAGFEDSEKMNGK